MPPQLSLFFFHFSVCLYVCFINFCVMPTKQRIHCPIFASERRDQVWQGILVVCLFVAPLFLCNLGFTLLCNILNFLTHPPTHIPSLLCFVLVFSYFFIYQAVDLCKVIYFKFVGAKIVVDCSEIGFVCLMGIIVHRLCSCLCSLMYSSCCLLIMPDFSVTRISSSLAHLQMQL